MGLGEVTYREAKRLGLEKAQGVRVTQIVPETPAYDAGIEPGDAILSWNGQEIRNPPELSLAVVRTRIGSEVTVELLRDGRRLELTAIVGQRPILAGP